MEKDVEIEESCKPAVYGKFQFAYGGENVGDPSTLSPFKNICGASFHYIVRETFFIRGDYPLRSLWHCIDLRG